MNFPFGIDGGPGGALIDAATGETLGPGDLARRVAARAKALAARGAAPGRVAALTRETGIPFFVDLFALWRCGATACVLDPALTAPEKANVERFLAPALRIGEEGDVPLGQARRMEGAGKAAPALILMTSGTTGDPKGVVLTQGALSARIAFNRAAIGDAVLSRTLLTLPLHFGHGLIGNALTPLAAGGTLVLQPRGNALATGLGRIVDEHAVTFLSSVPTFWRLVLRTSPPPAGGTLARVHVGSAPLSADLWTAIADWSKAETVNCFGITETANWIAGWPGSHGMADGRVGRPWGGELAVRGPVGAIQREGEGEVLVRSPCLLQSYLDRPDLTDAALVDGWFATGDTGAIDAAGVLTLSGRIKDEINRAGQKVQPADVDLVLEGHPDVSEACAFAVPDAIAGETVAAAVVAKDARTLERAALAAWCRGRLRPNAVPERWFFVDAIPRTPRGKVSRALVRRTLLGEGDV